MSSLATDIGKDVAVGFLSRPQGRSNFEIRREPLTVRNTALDTFERMDRLSLADALLVTSSRHNGVEYCYSFDDDFDAVPSVTRLDAPVDPTG